MNLRQPNVWCTRSFMIDIMHNCIWDNPHYDPDAPDKNDAVEITSDEMIQSTGQAIQDSSTRKLNLRLITSVD
jgi:hypothetical protein